MVDGNFSCIRHSIKPNCDHDIPYISILHENQHFAVIINNVYTEYNQLLEQFYNLGCLECYTGIKLMFVTLVTYIPTWRTRKMVN